GEELLRVTRVPDEVPAGLADLVRLPFRAIVATTWDDAPVRALEQAGSHPRVLTPSDPPPEDAFAAERILFRLLGDPGRPETLLASAREVRDASLAGGFRFVLEQIRRLRSLLLVGFELGDPDFALLYEHVLAQAPRGI